MRGARGNRRFAAGLVLGLVAATGSGCVHHGGGTHGHGGPPIAVPPPGEVPTELNKNTLPPYVVEPPDILLIEVVLRSEVENPDTKLKEPSTRGLPVQPVSGQFQVRIDGTVGLGFWGAVPVAGLTLDQTADLVRSHLLHQETLKKLEIKPENVVVIVDVLAYNSKRYYVITDGAGFGEQVFPFPVTGSETVLDAISNIGGLTALSSKNIWIARPAPAGVDCDQVLPVNWREITRGGSTATNYQVLPGDRIFISEDRFVALDSTLEKLLRPFERILGFSALGAQTIQQMQRFPKGFTQNGF